MNVIGYIRVSTQGQARDGYSLAYQEDEIKAYCQAHGVSFYYLEGRTRTRNGRDDIFHGRGSYAWNS